MKLLTHNLLSSHVPGLRPGGGFPLRIEVREGKCEGRDPPETPPVPAPPSPLRGRGRLVEIPLLPFSVPLFSWSFYR